MSWDGRCGRSTKNESHFGDCRSRSESQRDLNLALRLVEAAANAGADVVVPDFSSSRACDRSS